MFHVFFLVFLFFLISSKVFFSVPREAYGNLWKPRETRRKLRTKHGNLKETLRKTMFFLCFPFFVVFRVFPGLFLVF